MESCCYLSRYLSLLLLFLMGAVVGAFVNWFVDQFGWERKYRSPWSPLPLEWKDRLKRHLIDYIPLLGWWTMQRFSDVLFPLVSNKTFPYSKPPKKTKSTSEAKPAGLPGLEHRLFWIRPFLVELGLGLFAVGLFIWEVDQNAMFLKNINFLLQKVTFTCPVLSDFDLRWAFAIHFFLAVLMLAASLIDLDDYIIPDILTIPGTVLGLALFTLFPRTTYAPIPWFGGDQMTLDPVVYLQWLLSVSCNTTPVNSTSHLSYATNIVAGFMILCWAFWCFAILDRRWYLRLGVKKAFLLFVRTIYRSSLTKISFVLFLLGALAIFWISQKESDAFLNGRTALLNALLGMTFGMILTWSVRIVGRLTLGRESLGFGDVILMGMLGVYLGWQGTLVLFFLAPFAGIFFGIFRLMTRTEREIPYGPFLCLAALVWLLARNFFWNLYEPFFCDPMFVAILFPICFILLTLLLGLWRFIKIKIIRE